jgi:hypothetical protein
MAKDKKHKPLPRKGVETVRFIEKYAEVLSKRQEGSHVVMDVRGPRGEMMQAHVPIKSKSASPRRAASRPYKPNARSASHR